MLRHELTNDCVVFDANLLQQYTKIAAAVSASRPAAALNSRSVNLGSVGIVTAGVVAGLAVRDCIVVAAFGVTSWHSQAVASAYSPKTMEVAASKIGARYSALLGVEIVDTILLGVRAGIWWDEAVIASEIDIERSLCAGLLSAGIAWHSTNTAGGNRVQGSIVRGNGAGIHNTSSALTVETSWISASVSARLAYAKSASELLGDAIALADPPLEGTLRDITIRGCVLQAARYAVSSVGRTFDIVVQQNAAKGGRGGIVQESGGSGRGWVVADNDIQVTGQGSAITADTTLAGIWLSQGVLGEVRLNRIHDIGARAGTPLARVGVALEDCTSIVVADNTLTNIVGGGRPLAAVGIHAWSSVGRLDIQNNVIAIDGRGAPIPASDIVAFTPILIEAGLVELAFPKLFKRAEARAFVAPEFVEPAAASPGPPGAPTMATPYVSDAMDSTVLLAGRVLRLATYGAYYHSVEGDGVVSARGNSIDTHGVQPAVNIALLGNLMLVENRVRHAGTDSGYNGLSAITASADSMVVNANYVEAPVDPRAGIQVASAMDLNVAENRIAITTNVTKGTVFLNGAGLPAPWNALNVDLI